jgi:hypothetical protein
MKIGIEEEDVWGRRFESDEELMDNRILDGRII